VPVRLGPTPARSAGN